MAACQVFPLSATSKLVYDQLMRKLKWIWHDIVSPIGELQQRNLSLQEQVKSLSQQVQQQNVNLEQLQELTNMLQESHRYSTLVKLINSRYICCRKWMNFLVQITLEKCWGSTFCWLYQWKKRKHYPTVNAGHCACRGGGWHPVWCHHLCSFFSVLVWTLSLY